MSDAVFVSFAVDPRAFEGREVEGPQDGIVQRLVRLQGLPVGKGGGDIGQCNLLRTA